MSVDGEAGDGQAGDGQAGDGQADDGQADDGGADDAMPPWRLPTDMEPRWHVTAAIFVLVALQLTLATTYLRDTVIMTDWLRRTVEGFAVVELLAGAILLWADQRSEQDGSSRLRRLSLALVVLASLANLVGLVALLHRLLATDSAQQGGTLTASQLLGSGGMVWLSNVIVFSLWYWELDRGGPAARAAGREPTPDFLFPQMTAPQLFPGWAPRFADYQYVSWTNATAFSPTDTLPTTGWAKLAMMFQSGMSLVTVALVIARAVNILG